MPRFNFTIYDPNDENDRNHRADILDYDKNFKDIEEKSAIIDDLPKTKSITIASASWVSINDGEYYRYTISDALIHTEPYHIDILFSDLTIIEAPIYPQSNSQSEGSLVLETTKKPSIDLTATLIVTKGVAQ